METPGVDADRRLLWLSILSLMISNSFNYTLESKTSVSCQIETMKDTHTDGVASMSIHLDTCSKSAGDGPRTSQTAIPSSKDTSRVPGLLIAQVKPGTVVVAEGECQDNDLAELVN